MLADVLGGDVRKNSKGWELGSYNVLLTKAGMKDSLFEGIDDDEIFYESHQDVVTKLPPGSISLANTFKSNQSFVCSKNIYGVQFHPEFSWEVTRKLMDIRIKKGIQVDDNNLKISKYGNKILHNFIHIIESR